MVVCVKTAILISPTVKMTLIFLILSIAFEYLSILIFEPMKAFQPYFLLTELFKFSMRFSGIDSNVKINAGNMDFVILLLFCVCLYSCIAPLNTKNIYSAKLMYFSENKGLLSMINFMNF